MLGISATTARVRLHRTKARLGNLLVQLGARWRNVDHASRLPVDKVFRFLFDQCTRGESGSSSAGGGRRFCLGRGGRGAFTRG